MKWGKRDAILDRIAQKGITKKVTFEKRLEATKGTSHMKTWQRTFQKKQSIHKVSEVILVVYIFMYSAISKNSREIGEIMIGDEVRKRSL